MSVPSISSKERSAAVSEALARAIDRAAGTRAVGGNRITHHSDSPAALDAMLAVIGGAQQWIHLENYIIRSDATGRRFAQALAQRAADGVRVRVLYDAFGSLGTSRVLWRDLRRAGAEVRAFSPLLTTRPFDVFSRNHRKLVVADGAVAVTGGLCIGDEWAGNPARRRLPWRDSMVTVCGPAAAVLDRGFGRVWRVAGDPLPGGELAADAEPCGEAEVRVVEGVPGQARIYRAVQLLAAAARERLWITDAYLWPPPPLHASLVDAARDGVDVRVIVPGTSDVPVVRNLTRAGYRELLRAGIRVFEWRGPMLHAKTMLADHTWGRVGSSNLNVTSLLTNFELDILADDPMLCEELAAQFRRDLALSTEVVLQQRGRRVRLLPERLVTAPAEAGTLPLHKRSRRELGAVAAVALRRVAGGLRRTMAAAAAGLLLLVGVLFLVFPKTASAVAAVGAFWLALGVALSAVRRRRISGEDRAAAP